MGRSGDRNSVTPEVLHRDAKARNLLTEVN